MSKAVALPHELFRRAAELAAEGPVSVDDWVAGALAARLREIECVEMRANRFDRQAFERALNEIPDVEPEEYDRI